MIFRTEKRKEEEKTKKVLSGPHLVKELPLIKWEPIILAGTFLVAFTLTMQGFFGNLPKNIPLISNVVALLVPIVLWYWKYSRYLPTGKRSMVLRIFNSRISFISSEEIPDDNRIIMGKGRPSVRVGNPQKHVEAFSGRPLIICAEDRQENIDVLQANPIQPETRLLAFMAEEDEYRGRIGILRNQGKFGKFEIPQLAYIMIGAVILALIGVLYITYQQHELLTTIAEQVAKAERFVQVS